jgi:hypothetical protein
MADFRIEDDVPNSRFRFAGYITYSDVELLATHPHGEMLVQKLSEPGAPSALVFTLSLIMQALEELKEAKDEQNIV